jgi:cytochrome c oxidase subunit III
MITGDAAVFRVSGIGGGGDDGDIPRAPLAAMRRRARPQAIYGAGLWVFIGVATTLFSLFITAYIMRMSAGDATSVDLPRQLWFSTALLVLGSVLLHNATAAACASQAGRARSLLLAGGISAVAFVAAQGWAWSVLSSQQVTLTGNPFGSFFYLLTGMHALHVAGGLVGWWTVNRHVRRSFEDPAWRIALCARYWHFLLLAWLALYAALSWITPDVARIICRTA